MEGVILAAGKGTRMRPYSNAVNKEMSLIGSRPVIEYCVKALSSCGVRQICVVLSEGKSQIFEYLRDGSSFGVNVAYLYQDMSYGSGTAKAVEAASNWVRDRFMVLYGDSFFHPTDFFKDIVKLHEDEKADVTMGIYLMKDYKDYGILQLRGNEVTNILEKASEVDANRTIINGRYPVNSGPIVFNKSVFDYLKKTGVSPSGEYWLTDTIRLMIKDGKRVIGFLIPEGVFWRDIGRMEHRIEAERYLLNPSAIVVS